jgi:glycogen operon protein
MSEEDWETGHAKSIAIFLNGKGIHEVDGRGEPVVDDSFLLLINASDEDIDFALPDQTFGEAWQVVVDTTLSLVALDGDDDRSVKAGGTAPVEARSMMLLKRAL